MVVNWTLSDGTDTINFNPGATFKRTLDKTADNGLFIKSTGRNSTPIARSFKRSRDLLVVNTTFKNRESDYETLFTMVKEETNAANGTLTFTKGEDSFNVAVRRLIMSEDSGTGDMLAIECEMEIVRT